MLDRLDTKKWLKKLELEVFPEPEIISLKHPVLLCHGYGAIASLVKPSPLYDVALLVRTHGVPAFAPNIVPYAKIEIRAREWVDLVKKITSENGYDKLNIIAHSMGGLDIRYALSKFEISGKVESLTTVSTPHFGTSLAELALKTPDPIRDKLADFVDWMGDQIYPRTKSDTVGSIEQLTRSYVSGKFNPAVPDVDSIPYYSYSAAVGKGTDEPIKTIARFQNRHIYDQEGPNDGFVSVKSSKWGTHIKTVSLSHLEQINLRVGENRKKRYEKFWKNVLEMLKNNGH